MSCRCERRAYDFNALVNVIASTPRINTNVRHLKLRSRFRILGMYRYMAHIGQTTNTGISFDLFPNLFNITPYLHILELYDCPPDSSQTIPAVARLPHLDELRIGVSDPTLSVFDTLTFFARVDRLIIDFKNRSYVQSIYNAPLHGRFGDSPPPTALGALEVRSSLQAYTPLMQSLCTLVDATDLRTLTFDAVVPQELAPLLRTATALETLSYHVATTSAPPIPNPSSIRSLNVAGPLELGDGAYSMWDVMLRDCALFATGGQLTELGVTLRVFEDEAWVANDPLDRELAFSGLQESLQQLDWSALLAIAERQCPRLRELKINVVHTRAGPHSRAPRFLVEDHDRCGNVVLGVLQKSFASTEVPWCLNL